MTRYRTRLSLDQALSWYYCTDRFFRCYIKITFAIFAREWYYIEIYFSDSALLFLLSSLLGFQSWHLPAGLEYMIYIRPTFFNRKVSSCKRNSIYLSQSCIHKQAIITCPNQYHHTNVYKKVTHDQPAFVRMRCRSSSLPFLPPFSLWITLRITVTAHGKPTHLLLRVLVLRSYQLSVWYLIILYN